MSAKLQATENCKDLKNLDFTIIKVSNIIDADQAKRAGNADKQNNTALNYKFLTNQF